MLSKSDFKKQIYAIAKSKKRFPLSNGEHIKEILNEPGDELVDALWRNSKKDLNKSYFVLAQIDFAIGAISRSTSVNRKEELKKLASSMRSLYETLENVEEPLFFSNWGIPTLETIYGAPFNLRDDLMIILKESINSLEEFLKILGKSNKHEGRHNKGKIKLLEWIIRSTNQHFGKPTIKIPLIISKSDYVCKLYGKAYQNERRLEDVRNSLFNVTTPKT